MASESAQTGSGFSTTVDLSFTPQLFDKLAPRDASQLSLSPEGKAAIVYDEGNKSKVYPDSSDAHNPTSGIGHMLIGDEKTKYPMGSTVPQPVRDAWAAADLGSAQSTVRNLVKAPVNQFQFDALTNFAFQMGGPNLRASNLLRDINSAVPDQFGLKGVSPTSQQIFKDFHGWNLGGPGVPLRRDREINLYNNGIYP